MNRLILILFLLTSISGFSQIEPVIRTSTVEGVAPLAVFFDARQTSHENQLINIFHDLHYQWNFGDLYSGIWDYKPAARTTANGVLTTHVFEKGGVYIVELEVSDLSGNSSIETIVINVLDADKYYESTSVCVSTNDDFEGCPENAQKVIFEDGDLSVANAFIGNNRRLLFRRNDTINVREILKIEQAKNLTIGAYGKVDSINQKGIINNAPVFQLKNGNTVFEVSSSDGTKQVSNLIIQDLKIINTEVDSISSAIFCENYTQQNLFYHLDIDGFTRGIHYNYEHLLDSFHQQELFEKVTVANCEIKNSKGAGDLIYINGKQIALLGNVIQNAQNAQSILKSSYLQNAVIAHNQFLYPAKDNSCFQLETPINNELCSNIIIQDNHFVSCEGSETIVQIQSKKESKLLQNIIFEGNFINAGKDKSVRYSLLVTGKDITIRNNIINGSWANKTKYVGIAITDISSDLPHNIKAYNNTIYRSDWVNMAIGVSVGKTIDKVEISNNLLYIPSAVKYKVTENYGKNSLINNNTFPKENPFLNKKPIEPVDFQLDTINLKLKKINTSLCSFNDFYGQSRKQNNQRCNIGAFQFTETPIIFDVNSFDIEELKTLPNRRYLSIDLSKISSEYNVEIYNLNNDLVYSDYELQNRFYVWNIDGFENGIYWVKVISRNATFLTKVMVHY